MPKPIVTIPKSDLRRQLDEAAAIKREMAKLLREVEKLSVKPPDIT